MYRLAKSTDFAALVLRLFRTGHLMHAFLLMVHAVESY